MPRPPKAAPPKAQPTLLDVARATGLSPATISLALNRRPEECTLAEATRRRAIAAAHRLGYRPNWRARALVSRRSHTVGFVYAREAPFMGGVNEAIVRALSDTFHGFNYHQLLVPLIGNPDYWRDVIRPDRLDGCIVLFPMPEQMGKILEDTHLPMVSINVRSNLPIPTVIPDDVQGIGLLMDHLLSLGHRDIAFFYRTPNLHFSVQTRVDGYEAAMRKAGLADRIQVYAHPGVEGCMDQYLRAPRRPTAMIAFDHVQGVSLLHECARRGVRVPDDLSVAIFNDVFPAAFTVPALTAVALPGEEMGRTAARLLVQLIDQKGKDGSLPEAPSQCCLPVRLVVRDSTAAPRQP